MRTATVSNSLTGSDNPNGLLLQRDELMGWLRGLEKQGHECDRAFYLESWNGTGDFTFDRIGRGTVHIPAACITILGTIQPGPLAEYVAHAAGGGAGNDGLLQRFQIMVYPDDPGEWQNVDRRPDIQARENATEVFERLAELEPSDIGAVLDHENGVPYLQFDEEAQELFDHWREQLENRLRRTKSPSMQAHLAKYRSLVPALALLFHLAEGEGGPVGVVSMARAEAWAEYLETHARRVYADSIDPAVKPTRALARKLQAGHVKAPFTARDIYRRHWSGLDKETVKLALRTLESFNWIKGSEKNGEGRPSREYRINPRLEVEQ